MSIWAWLHNFSRRSPSQGSEPGSGCEGNAIDEDLVPDEHEVVASVEGPDGIGYAGLAAVNSRNEYGVASPATGYGGSVTRSSVQRTSHAASQGRRSLASASLRKAAPRPLRTPVPERPRRIPSPSDGASTPDPERGSPDFLPPDEVAQVLAGAIVGYVRPQQPGGILPAPGRPTIDRGSPEQRAWNAVFQADSDLLTRAIEDYLTLPNDERGVIRFLARIADVHGEHERMTRRRLTRRYLNDLPWHDENRRPDVENQATMLGNAAGRA